MSEGFDRDLTDLPQALRWREWRARVEAVLFAAETPVAREVLARVVGQDCALDLLIEDLEADLSDRPYGVFARAGGWQMLTRPRYADAIHAAHKQGQITRLLSPHEALVLTVIAYMQPVTRAGITRVTGRALSRDMLAKLHQRDLIARGPRSPEPGAPYTYVTASGFLAQFGMESLADLPDIEALQDAGLLETVAADTRFAPPIAKADD